MPSPLTTSVSRCLHHTLGYLQLNLALVECDLTQCTPEIIQAYRHTTKTFHIKTYAMGRNVNNVTFCLDSLAFEGETERLS